MTPIIPRHAKMGEGFSKSEILKSAEHPGRQSNSRLGYQSASTWICHLLDLRKPVILCNYCRPKFSPKKAKYRLWWCPDSTGQNGFMMRGQCDDCKQPTLNAPGGGVMFVPEENYPSLCKEPPPSRVSVRARAKMAGQSAWQFIQSMRR